VASGYLQDSTAITAQHRLRAALASKYARDHDFTFDFCMDKDAVSGELEGLGMTCALNATGDQAENCFLLQFLKDCPQTCKSKCPCRDSEWCAELPKEEWLNVGADGKTLCTGIDGGWWKSECPLTCKACGVKTAWFRSLEAGNFVCEAEKVMTEKQCQDAANDECDYGDKDATRQGCEYAWQGARDSLFQPSGCCVNTTSKVVRFNTNSKGATAISKWNKDSAAFCLL